MDVCRRRFNPNNYKGRWKDEEMDFLKEYVKTQGRHWEDLAKMLGRTAPNVRDKYKEMGEGNYEKRNKQQ